MEEKIGTSFRLLGLVLTLLISFTVTVSKGVGGGDGHVSRCSQSQPERGKKPFETRTGGQA